MLIEAGSNLSVLSLGKCSDQMRQGLASLGVAWSDGSDLADADVVLVHYWNTPAMQRFVRSAHPPARVVVWLMVEGGTRPNVITPELAAFADVLMATSSSTLSLPYVKERSALYIPPPVDLASFWPRPPIKETPFRVGYLGTVDFVKMHPDYVAMSAAVPDEDVRFCVWGFGNAYAALKGEAARLKQEHRFQFHGTTEDAAAAAFASMHVYGYPLCEDSYGTCDRSMQEAMAMALPSVVLDRPGLRDLAIDGVTALVARSAQDYAAAIMQLKRDPDLRMRLGRSAQDHVRLRFEPGSIMGRLCRTLTDALSMPKRARKALDAGLPITGARLFVASLGHLAGEYARNLCSFEGRRANEGELIDDEQAIAAATPGLCNPGAGGILSYRAAYPGDPVLRFWSGLIFSHQGRHAVALAEFLAALQLGVPKKRLEPHLAPAGRHCGLSDGAIADYASQEAGAVLP
jgi:hypothetical protein